MDSNQKFVDFVTEQIQKTGTITARKMVVVQPTNSKQKE